MAGHLVSLPSAKLHLRVDTSDEDALITSKLIASERLAMAWIRRNVYADAEALAAAVQAAPVALSAATAAYEAALALANAATNELERQAAVSAAQEAYTDAQGEVKRTRRGVVLDGLFESAVLLTLGQLYENRELLEPPSAAQMLLDPLRAYG